MVKAPFIFLCIIGIATGFVANVCPGAAQSTFPNSPQIGAARNPLTTAEQVHRLTREEASLGHQVRLRGVVTCSLPDSEAVVIQDATRGIYVSHLGPELGKIPSVGDLLELEGITDPGEFAPSVLARRVNRVGVGELPQPIRPAWDRPRGSRGACPDAARRTPPRAHRPPTTR